MRYLLLCLALCFLMPAAGVCQDYKPRMTDCLGKCADAHIDQVDAYTECAADCPVDKRVTRFVRSSPREIGPGTCWATCQDQFYGCYQDCPGGIEFPFDECVEMCANNYQSCVRMCIY